MNVVLYHGSMDARRFMVKQEFYYTDQFVPKLTAQKLKRLNVTKFDVLITNHFNSSDQHFNRRGLIFKGRSRSVNGIILLGLDGAGFINRLSNYIHNSS